MGTVRSQCERAVIRPWFPANPSPAAPAGPLVPKPVICRCGISPSCGRAAIRCDANTGVRSLYPPRRHPLFRSSPISSTTRSQGYSRTTVRPGVRGNLRLNCRGDKPGNSICAGLSLHSQADRNRTPAPERRRAPGPGRAAAARPTPIRAGRFSPGTRDSRSDSRHCRDADLTV